ncbi:uncharacterized protein [Montipora foliosa]|uniref:uncharacterized protein isoform X2 n=1 Tax=Montipora foliosa TaxID=591990 RepID=UPI0035F16D45
MSVYVMNMWHLCIFAVAILPNVLAIHCYDCVPKPPTNLCTSDLNITDCDTLPDPFPGFKSDACLKVSYEMEFGFLKKDVNSMSCSVKSMCDLAKGPVKKRACNETLWKKVGITLKKCEIDCCSGDKCNGLGTGSIQAASFIVTFLSVVGILAGVFIH